jgi:peptidoglycan hydrolase CwlO-like protein
MKNIAIVLSTLALAACGTTTMPAQSTGTEGEYVVSSTNQDSVFSTVEKALQGAENEAIKTCAKMNKVYKKKYTVDTPMRIGQVPGTTLYFTCVDKN